MELRDYLSVLRRRKAIIVMTLVIATAAAAAGSFLLAPKYTAAVTLRITPGASIVDGSIRPDDIEYLERLHNTYARLVTSDVVLNRLARELNLDAKPDVVVEQIPNSELMEIRVEAERPALAARSANRLAELLIARVEAITAQGVQAADERLRERIQQVQRDIVRNRQELAALRLSGASDAATEARILELQEEIELNKTSAAALQEEYERYRIAREDRGNALSILEAATPPQEVSSPNTPLIVALGIFVGLVGGMGLAFLFENVSTRLYTRDEIERATDLPVLATVPTAKNARVTPLFNSASSAEEAFRRLRTRILALDGSEPLRTLLVTSAEPREGKSTVVANLGRTIVQAGLSVVVVDAVLRRPRLHEIFGISNEVGLSDVLKGMPVEEGLQETTVPGLFALPAGPTPESPADLLGSPEMESVVAELAQRFDIVLVDAPSVLTVADPLALAPTLDAVLLVVAQDTVRREGVEMAREELARANARLLGVVLNRADSFEAQRYYEETRRTERRQRVAR